MLHMIYDEQSGPCTFCGHETACRNTYGEFECILCAGALSGNPLSTEAYRVWERVVVYEEDDEQDYDHIS